MIIHGDLFDVLPTLDAESIEACVTDPPYALSFMGHQWDQWDSPAAYQQWCCTWAREVFRVLKPGAHLATFGGTRTFHRLTVGIEEAGFVIRDCLSWLYGAGFPKSLNVGDGRGTALKPAWEPIILARKSLVGTVAGTVERHGTGALNIEACRIDGSVPVMETLDQEYRPGFLRSQGRTQVGVSDRGRWPANVVLDPEAAAMMDAQSGELVSGTAVGGLHRMSDRGARVAYGPFKGNPNAGDVCYGDSGGASRFFYVAKPSREERDTHSDTRNTHPTVKPVALMRWLVRLVTPRPGTVLDPFAGSGTTGMACRYEVRGFIGIEREAAYVRIAERRIAATLPLFGDDLEVIAR